MEVANPPAAAAPTGTDWRTQLHPKAREVVVKQIMKTLKKHIPLTDSEGLNRLQNIADGFEQKFYTSATSQSSYSRKIAMLLLYVESPNQNPSHQAPGLPLQGNSPAQSSAAPLMAQQKTRQGNISAYVQASSLPSPGTAEPVLQSASKYLENNADEKSKAPMLESPGDEIIDEEFWNDILFPSASDNEPQHSGTVISDMLELLDQSENIQLLEGTSTAADPVSSELSMPEFSRNMDWRGIFDRDQNWSGTEHMDPDWIKDLNYVAMVGRTTNLKKRKFDGASSSPAPVFGPVDDQSSSPAASS